MNEQLTRIGRGVPELPPPRPGPRAPLALWLGLGAFGAVLVFLATYYAFDGQGARPPTSSHTTQAAIADLGVEATCALLIPLATTSTTFITAIAAKPDGSTIDWAELEKAVTDLSTTKSVAPPEMRDDIQEQIDPLLELQQRHNGTWPGSGLLDLSDYRASGLRLAARCAPFAR